MPDKIPSVEWIADHLDYFFSPRDLRVAALLRADAEAGDEGALLAIEAMQKDSEEEKR